jgi:hypothetical protein
MSGETLPESADGIKPIELLLSGFEEIVWRNVGTGPPSPGNLSLFQPFCWFGFLYSASRMERNIGTKRKENVSKTEIVSKGGEMHELKKESANKA